MLSGLLCGFHIVKAIALLYRRHRFTYMVERTDKNPNNSENDPRLSGFT